MIGLGLYKFGCQSVPVSSRLLYSVLILVVSLMSHDIQRAAITYGQASCTGKANVLT